MPTEGVTKLFSAVVEGDPLRLVVALLYPASQYDKYTKEDPWSTPHAASQQCMLPTAQHSPPPAGMGVFDLHSNYVNVVGIPVNEGRSYTEVPRNITTRYNTTQHKKAHTIIHAKKQHYTRLRSVAWHVMHRGIHSERSSGGAALPQFHVPATTVVIIFVGGGGGSSTSLPQRDDDGSDCGCWRRRRRQRWW